MGCGPTTRITKGTLNFKAKAWWALVWHKPSPTMGDNMLKPDIASLFAGIIEGYEINVSNILAREI